MNSLMAGPWVQTWCECRRWQICEEELAGQWEDLCHVFASERELQTRPAPCAERTTPPSLLSLPLPGRRSRPLTCAEDQGKTGLILRCKGNWPASTVISRKLEMPLSESRQGARSGLPSPTWPALPLVGPLRPKRVHEALILLSFWLRAGNSGSGSWTQTCAGSPRSWEEWKQGKSLTREWLHSLTWGQCPNHSGLRVCSVTCAQSTWFTPCSIRRQARPTLRPERA